MTDERLPWADPLTAREIEALDGAARGEWIAETGRRIFLSEGTLKTHRRSARIKLGAKTTTGAVVAAIRYGIITPPGFDADAAELRAARARLDAAREHLEAALAELESAA